MIFNSPLKALLYAKFISGKINCKKCLKVVVFYFDCDIMRVSNWFSACGFIFLKEVVSNEN